MVLAFLFPAWNAEPFRDAVSRVVPYLPVALYAAVGVMLALSFVRSRRSGEQRAPSPFSARLDGLRFLAGPAALGACVIAYLASLVENWESGSRRFFTIGGVVPTRRPTSSARNECSSTASSTRSTRYDR